MVRSSRRAIEAVHVMRLNPKNLDVTICLTLQEPFYRLVYFRGMGQTTQPSIQKPFSMIKVHDINCDLLNDLNDLISLIINSHIYDAL